MSQQDSSPFVITTVLGSKTFDLEAIQGGAGGATAGASETQELAWPYVPYDYEPPAGAQEDAVRQGARAPQLDHLDYPKVRLTRVCQLRTLACCSRRMRRLTPRTTWSCSLCCSSRSRLAATSAGACSSTQTPSMQSRPCPGSATARKPTPSISRHGPRHWWATGTRATEATTLRRTPPVTSRIHH